MNYLLFDLQVGATLGQIGRKGGVGTDDTAGEWCQLLVLGQDIVANDLVVVGDNTLTLLHVGTVHVVGETACLDLRGNLLAVDGHVHVELEESGNLDVALGTDHGDVLLKGPVVEEHGTGADDVVLVLDDVTCLNIGHHHVDDHIVVVNALPDKVLGVDGTFLHLALGVLGEDLDLEVLHVVGMNDDLVVGIEIGDVDIGMLHTLGLEDLGAQGKLVVHDDVGIVDVVLAVVHEIAGAELGVGHIVGEHLVGEPVGDCHRLAEDDGVGIGLVAVAKIIPFLIGGFAELLVGKLCMGYGSACKECQQYE